MIPLFKINPYESGLTHHGETDWLNPLDDIETDIETDIEIDIEIHI